jgi:hypothetical protein
LFYVNSVISPKLFDHIIGFIVQRDSILYFFSLHQEREKKESSLLVLKKYPIKHSLSRIIFLISERMPCARSEIDCYSVLLELQMGKTEEELS